jgi:hypothetical protein
MASLRDDLVDSISKAVTKEINGIVEDAVAAALTGGSKKPKGKKAGKATSYTLTKKAKGALPGFLKDAGFKGKADLLKKYKYGTTIKASDLAKKAKE